MKKIIFLLLLSSSLLAQIKPAVHCIGGDNIPQLKQQFQSTLEMVLLEMNRINKGTGSLEALKSIFTNDAYQTFKQYVLTNGAYTIRREYQPTLIEREQGKYFDIRGITVSVHLGETEASSSQNLIFTFDANGTITSVRSMLPNYDYQSVISSGKSERDSLIRGFILDFMERFRMAYNTKDIQFLEKVYSDDALIFVGSVLEEKKGADDMLKRSFLSNQKVRLIQQSKREYIAGLKQKAFAANSFINVKFSDVQILQHEKVPYMYGVSCMQEWRSANYSDKGYLFLMIDFRNQQQPVIHVRAWQPNAFEEGNAYVSLYDFDIVEYK